MARIAHLIHESQGSKRKKAVAGVIFDHDGRPRRSRGIPQQEHRIVRVMQYIHKHYDVEATVIVGKRLAVKHRDRNMGLGADEDIDSVYVNVRALLHHQSSEQTVTAADIQDASPPRDQLDQLIPQDPHPPVQNVSVVNLINEGHG